MQQAASGATNLPSHLLGLLLHRIATLILITIFTTLSIDSVISGEQPAKGSVPNIVLILADDLGYGDLGCFGQKVIQTPHIDQMAAEGMRFTNCYAGSTVCAPSRCCLMTGLHTGHAFIRGNARIPLPPEEVTVAEVVKKAGYTTALIGKWGLGEARHHRHPEPPGLRLLVYGYLNQRNAHNYYPEYLYRNGDEVHLRNVVDRSGKPDHPGGVATKRGEYSHDLFTQEALDFVERPRR